MIKAVKCSALFVVLEKLKEIVKENELSGRRTVIFCEDRLTLAAERAVCAAVDGSFLTSVYTFARFLTAERGKSSGVLTSRGSAMAVRRIMEEHKGEFSVFKKAGAAGTAQSVYDTIALLYASGVSAEDLYEAAQRSGELKSKLADIVLVYSEYVKYLSENGLQDRNGYLRRAAEAISASPKIRGGSVVFLGFQAFTGTTSACVKAAFNSADSVYGLFVGGEEDIYVNEAYDAFIYYAKDFGGAKEERAHTVLNADAEILRRRLFNPESYRLPPEKCSFVRAFEAADREDELEFIAASIKRHVLDFGERYAKISVMIPDLENCERAVSRVFSRYEIPYFADIRYPLSGHALGAFILDFLRCAASGLRMQDVNRVISSPLFPAERGDKDVFKNYMLRFCSYRGGVKRKPDSEILNNAGFDPDAVERVRTLFLNGLAALTEKGVNSNICGGLRKLLNLYKAEEKLKELSEKFKDDKPLAAGFSARAYEAALSVIAEAESIGGDLPVKEFIKLISTGFSAMKISIIPPKSDAVFVGDLTSTVNVGTNVAFAAGLTESVPPATADTALITDREIAVLESVNVNVSPKIRQVNLRTRETVALNICAFKKNLYLSYPVQTGEDAHTPSEIISYACACFTAKSGGFKCADLRRIKKSPRSLPYYCSEITPALSRLKDADEREAAAIYSVLKGRGLEERAAAVLNGGKRAGISCGKSLYLKYGSLSPTTLEAYFSCPYRAFMEKGLGVQEREEGAVRALDAGNFVHSVLEDTAKEAEKYGDEKDFAAFARKVAEEKLKKPPYSALADSLSGEYLAGELADEAAQICTGMYLQLKNSSFKVVATEKPCTVGLSDGVKIYGRIDRVDESGDMVRIIDYKTGVIDSKPAKYYTGAKLQLPLYLLAASENKRPVGAYYFPAKLEYSAKSDGVFRLEGFMDGGADVVRASDLTLTDPKRKSAFVDAYVGGSKGDAGMPSEDFPYFLRYSALASDVAAKEMLSGNIAPSPAEGTCDYCRAGGSCDFMCGTDGEERKAQSVKCTQIAALVRELTEGKNE